MEKFLYAPHELLISLSDLSDRNLIELYRSYGLMSVFLNWIVTLDRLILLSERYFL